MPPRKALAQRRQPCIYVERPGRSPDASKAFRDSFDSAAPVHPPLQGIDNCSGYFFRNLLSERYNQEWLLEPHGRRTPSEVRQELMRKPAWLSRPLVQETGIATRSHS